jgi:hypothetical protein
MSSLLFSKFALCLQLGRETQPDRCPESLPNWGIIFFAVTNAHAKPENYIS